MAIRVNCECGKKYSVNDELAGKKAKCKNCGAQLAIPELEGSMDSSIEKELESSSVKEPESSPVKEPESSPAKESESSPSKKPESSPAPAKKAFKCQCGKTYVLKAEYAGKKIRCSNCKKVFKVPEIKPKVPSEMDSQAPKDFEIPQKETVAKKKKIPEQDDVPISLKVIMFGLIALLVGAVLFAVYLIGRNLQCNDPEIQNLDQLKLDPSIRIEGEATPPGKAGNVVKTEPDLPKAPVPAQLPEKITDNIPETKSDQMPENASEPEKTEVQTANVEEQESIEQEPEPEPVEKPRPVITQIEKPVQKAPVKVENKKTEKKKPVELASISPSVKKEYGKFRMQPGQYSEADVTAIFLKYNFYDVRRNRGGFFANKFVDNRNGTITDRASNLMWQKAGSADLMAWTEAAAYINELNKKRFAGYSDWRIPTLDELLTLSEQRITRQGLYIAPIFSQKQGICASADTCIYENKPIPWFASFLRGVVNCNTYGMINKYYIKAVRSLK